MTIPSDPERRPLPTRETIWAKAIAANLSRRGASPNGISIAGMIAAIAAGLCLVASSRIDMPWQSLCLVVAAGLIALRLLANMFDGMVAIATGKTSPVGELFNEVPDRISDSVILISAGYASGGMIELGYGSACLAVFIAYIRAQGKVAGAHSEFCGPMAKPHRMAAVIVASLAAAFIPQESLIASTRLGVVGWALVAILLGGIITVIRRLRKIAGALKGNS